MAVDPPCVIGHVSNWQLVSQSLLHETGGTHSPAAFHCPLPATNALQMEYLNLMFKYKMLDSVKEQLWHLLKGLY